MADRIDIYPVGVLADLLMLRRARRYGALGWALRRLAQTLRYVARRARAGQWREVKGAFNGYLAEPTPFPAHLRRCGSGWTKRRAMRSLHRHGYRQTGP
ncbi:hypothetical protein AWW66_03425 [Micromonospora rosaria]|uniref:Uncharacterized protein n=1 Tax=Micromonospora rosaria TaxID=47874 RepID=A0A136PYE6_9ACTN|nr:hypothetical protein [Micromonospora rosaria]KXK63377.1 hypothetical protein AWW66_03425 [Micromonospora rosaria]